MKTLILIVEDEPAIADNIKYALTTEGFDTDWFASGRGIIDYIEKNPVSLIILDIGLPDINGMELCKEIRKISQIPIIFLTARSDELDKVVGLEIGADDYMVKPFSPRELTARVKAVLRRTESIASVEVDDKAIITAFEINKQKYQITYYGSLLELSRYEFLLLELLNERPGQIFTRDQIMLKIWDSPDMSMDRTIDTHIKNIRAKLKIIKPGIDPIKTHRGIGYSLKEGL